jgi:hypothetical protein
VRSYAEVEGKSESERCIGSPPPRDQYGQVDEWSLLRFALPSEIPLETLCALKADEYRFSTPAKPAETSVAKKWWKFW